MKATKTAASSTALILWKNICTCEHKKKIIDQIPSAYISQHTVVSPNEFQMLSDVLVRWEESDCRDGGVNEMASAEGLALFLSSLPL